MAITKARMQVKRGNESDFDPSQMLPGEWAVSLDTKYVRMCFAPGICVRMATYDAFEADMEEIRDILLEAQTIQEAVARIQTEINDTAVVVEDYSILSKSYAVGGTGKRENEDSDNAKYYYEQTKQISQGINGIVPMGTVAFADLPTSNIVNNAMYNVSDAFTSDARFNDGGGIYYGPGNNVIWTAEGKWDVTASSSVTGIKGSAESAYRVGNVNITPSNIGLGNVNNTSDADKPISTTTQAALDALNGSLVNGLATKISWSDAIASLYGREMFYGTGVLNIRPQQSVSDNGYHASLIFQETGWNGIELIIPIMHSNIPVIMNVQHNIIYAYLVDGNGSYDNVPFSYIAIGWK